MALHIIQGSNEEDLKAGLKHVGELGDDIELGNIESRVNEHDANRYHRMWKKLLSKYEAEGGDIDELFMGDGGAANDSELLGETSEN